MTTIACNLFEMAADTRVSIHDPVKESIVVFPSTKIERINNALIGSSGDFQAGVRFHDWMRAGQPRKKPRLCKDFRALMLKADGIWTIEGPDDTWMRVDSEFYAIGSGGKVAIGALKFGASPKDAVEAAKEWDAWSGGKVTVLSLGVKCRTP